MTLTKANTITSQVKTLAKLYLEGKPAEISHETIAQLCDWLMDEFHQLQLNLQFSDYMRYDNAKEMFADIEQGQLWVSADSYDSAIYPNPIYGFIFQGMHDYDHYLTDSDFSLEGEIVAYNLTAKRAPSLDIQKILYSEIVLRSAAYLYLGYAVNPKIVFPESITKVKDYARMSLLFSSTIAAHSAPGNLLVLPPLSGNDASSFGSKNHFKN